MSCYPFESFQVRVPAILSDKQEMVDEAPFRKLVYGTVIRNFVCPVVTSIGNWCPIEKLSIKGSCI
jgi:hypothetical protein